MKKLIIILFMLPLILAAQPKEEVRAVWLTTVWNLDWPKVSGEAAQKASMIEILNSLQDANFNTVMFQVRARGDLIYPSIIEPWAKAMTGTLGQNPGWDPLEFVINECHARGIEVHAWFVAYNVYSGSAPPPATSPNHVVNAHPELCKLYESGGSYSWWMDPGIPETREYLVDVSMEMVNNYELDALHYDYIRYPSSDFDDADTYATYGGGQDLGDWRRANINQFVYDVYDSVQAVKPWVKVGSAPIGIHHNIPGASGWQGYYEVYQDARDWAEQGKHDYICPQIYWDMSSRFPYLVDDWVENSFGRPIYTGIAAYRMESKKEKSLIKDNQSFAFKAIKDNPKGWAVDEILNQIDYTRSAGGLGQTYFRTLHVTYNIKNLHTLLKENQYLYPANIPAMPWKDNIPPNKPQNLVITINNPTSITLDWDEPTIPTDGDTVKYYNIYQSLNSPIDIDDIKNVIKFQHTGETSATIEFETAPTENVFFTVTAYDKGYNESEPANEVNIANFNLLTPENSSVDILNEVSFTWEPLAGATSYTLQVSDDESFSNLVVDETDLSETSFFFDNLNYNKQYFWKVKPNNLSTYSSVWNFSTSRLEKLWIKNTEDGNLPAWFSTTGNTERGIAYGNELLYIVSRSSGVAVYIINSADGSDIGNLDVSAISGGTYGLNDVETGTDGSILACNLTTDASVSPFKVYKWINESSTSIELINYTASSSYRLGDNFTVVGDLNSEAVIYTAASGSNHVFKWSVIGGVIDTDPDIITLSGIANIGTSPSVAPLGNLNTDDFYINGHSAISPTLFSADGTNKGSIPESIIGLSNSSVTSFMFQNFRYTTAFQSADVISGTSGQNAVVILENAPLNELNIESRYGVSEKTGANENIYAVGDVTYKNESNTTEPIIYVLSTNNGFGAFRFTEIPPMATNINISGTTEVYYELTGTYTYEDMNGDTEEASLYQWYRADDAIGTGKTLIYGADETSYTLNLADEGKFLFFEVTPIAQTGILTGAPVQSPASNVIIASSAAAPVASNVYLSGTFATGQELTGNYTYSDANGDLEGNSLHKWYKADDASGTNQLTILGANNQTYTLIESVLGKYISYRVTPVAQTGIIPETLTGEPVTSDFVGPVILDIKELLASKIKLYPNPIIDKLEIQNISSVKYISIVNILGKEIRTINLEKNIEHKIEINTTDIKKGIYLIKFKTENNIVFTKKIIKL